MKVHCLWLACLLLCAAALGACGGDSDGNATADSGSQETTAEGPEIPDAVQEAVAAGVEGKYSTEATEVLDLDVEGEKATAEVMLLGGTLHEQTVEAVLVRDKKGWKLDELTKFVELDKPLLVENYEAETQGLPENFKPKVVRCLTRKFAGSSQAEIEAMYLERDRSLFLALGKGCLNN